MIIPNSAFKKVLELPNADWTSVSDQMIARVVERCQQRLAELPQVTEIEGIKKLTGAKYLYEKSLIDTLEALGAPISEETRTELLLADFLS